MYKTISLANKKIWLLNYFCPVCGSEIVPRIEHFGKLSAGHDMNKSKTWYVYMLLCDQKTFYVGFTPEIVHRYRQHKNKQSFFTKQFSDLKFVYSEQYDNEHDAAIREKQIKGWSRAKKQMLIDGKLGINTCTEFVEELLVGENPM